MNVECMSVGSVRWTPLNFLLVQFSIVSCDNAVLMLWLGLGPKEACDISQFLVKIISFLLCQTQLEIVQRCP